MTTRILTGHAESTTALVEQTQTCLSASWAIAWATPNKVFDAAFANIDKFDRLIIGTHGCHTHPDCLEKLGPYPQVSIRRSDKEYALFHPKLYFFEHADHYAVVIGSHNLTAGAFQRNVELSTMSVFAKEEPAADALRTFIKEESHPTFCLPYGPTFLKRYRDLYSLARKQRRDLEKLVDNLPSSDAERKRREAPIYMSWPQFYDKARHDQAGSLEERLKVLRYIRDLFRKTPNFADMHPNDHLRIAGLASAKMCVDDGIDWNLFGSMNVGDAYGQPYGPLIQKQPAAVAKALSHIPLDEPVTQEDFDAYWADLKAALPDGGKGLGRAGATRLVCMMRPDSFVSLNNRSAEKLAVQLGIKASDLASVDNYWTAVMAPIQLTPWWTTDRPTDPSQLEVWDFRAALLDVLVKEN